MVHIRRTFPYFGIRFFTIIQPFGLKIFMGTQETIIDRLVMRNPRYDAYFWFLIFLGHFGQENACGHHAPPNGLGPPNPTKKLANWLDLSGKKCKVMSINQKPSLFPLLLLLTYLAFITIIQKIFLHICW